MAGPQGIRVEVPGIGIVTFPAGTSPDEMAAAITSSMANKTKEIQVGSRTVTVPFDVTPAELQTLQQQMDAPVQPATLARPTFARDAGSMMDASMGAGGGSVDPLSGRLAPVALPIAGNIVGGSLSGGAGLVPWALGSGTGYGLGKAASGSSPRDALAGGIENAVLTGTLGAGASAVGKIALALRQPSAAAAARTAAQKLAQEQSAWDADLATRTADAAAARKSELQATLEKMKPTQIRTEMARPSSILDPATGKPIMVNEPVQFEKPSGDARDILEQARNRRAINASGVIDAPDVTMPTPRPTTAIPDLTGPATRGGELMRDAVRYGAGSTIGYGLYDALRRMWGGS